jgi:hypothetical protein
MIFTLGAGLCAAKTSGPLALLMALQNPSRKNIASKNRRIVLFAPLNRPLL